MIDYLNKSMSKRIYNIYFHLHTVSGIVISVGLFVIFLAGAFSLFLEDIRYWEKKQQPRSVAHTVHYAPLDLDRLMTALDAAGYDLYGRSIHGSLDTEEPLQSVYLSGSEDSLASEEDKRGYDLIINKATYAVQKSISSDESRQYSLGELLYELHFFRQLGDVGYYLAGAVSLFMLFAIVTGFVIHWKKIVSNFYVFRPREKLKTVWTDAHTALGTIGLPFQFMYAITGVMFCLGILIRLTGALFYGGDEEKYESIIYVSHHEPPGNRTDIATVRFDDMLNIARNRWMGFEPTRFEIRKCESTNMEFLVSGRTNKLFPEEVNLLFNAVTGEPKQLGNADAPTLHDSVWSIAYKLHYAEPGVEWGSLAHYLLRISFFVLSLLTCFVIITGVLIWLEARNRKAIPEKQRRFNEGVGHIYIAVCLSMLPVTAVSFLVSKLIPDTYAEQRHVILNWVFFGSWLILSLFFWQKKNNHFTNKYSLIGSGILGLCIPLVSGMISDNWPWRSFAVDQYGVFVIDMLWLLLALIAFYVVFKLKRKPPAFG